MTTGTVFPTAAVRAAWERFPAQHATTQRFSLGVPRSFVVAGDGSRVVFLRTRAGDDPVGCLWVYDVAADAARVVADPRALETTQEQLTPEERARRERVRESAAGITSFATDGAVTQATFVLAGHVFLTNLAAGSTQVLDAEGGAFDPRLDAMGHHVAFARSGALWVTPTGDGSARRLISDDDPAVTWGVADFIAAEEMNRYRGFWWAPDGSGLLAARVDEGPVTEWHVHNPAEPSSAPVALRYPAAGTPNAEVALAMVGLDGQHTPVPWDTAAYPYLADVSWTSDLPIITVQSRDQRRTAVLEAAPATGATTVRTEITDDHWVELTGGLPYRLPDGRLVHWVEDAAADRRRLAVDGVAVSSPDLQLRSVASVDADTAVVTASSTDPTSVEVWRVPLDGAQAVQLSDGPGVHQAAAAGDVVVLASRTLDRPDVTTAVHHPGGTGTIAAVAERPSLEPSPTWVSLGTTHLASALLLPTGWTPDDGPLPVLLDPYGGPHAQRVLRAGTMFGPSQWFADAGFAVLVTDGRGSPGRGHAWERAVAGDLAGPPLDDQVAALHAAAQQFPGTLDLGRVGIRGWSFGGFLAALAVLRRPDVFHAAVAGAPVTEWRLYDTHYTERYLGDPNTQPDTYDASSLLPHAAELQRPLLLIHGLADDNVVAAHTLQLSRALLAASRPHRVLPLAGVTHMTPQPDVAQALLNFQLDFLSSALSSGTGRSTITLG